METIGKDQRTIDKYLKILQDEDIIYDNSLGGIYEVQSWVFGDFTIFNKINNNNYNYQYDSKLMDG